MTIDFSKPYDRYIDVLPLVTPEGRARLLEEAEKKRPMYELTLGEFFAICGGDMSAISNGDYLTVGEGLWLERFAEFVDEFGKVLEKITPQQTQEQKQASAACLPVEWQEGMLVFAREYFGLKSFAEAEQVTLADFIMAKKDNYNKVVFERAYNKIQSQKLKHK